MSFIFEALTSLKINIFIQDKNITFHSINIKVSEVLELLKSMNYWKIILIFIFYYAALS